MTDKEKLRLAVEALELIAYDVVEEMRGYTKAYKAFVKLARETLRKITTKKEN